MQPYGIFFVNYFSKNIYETNKKIKLSQTQTIKTNETSSLVTCQHIKDVWYWVLYKLREVTLKPKFELLPLYAITVFPDVYLSRREHIVAVEIHPLNLCST